MLSHNSHIHKRRALIKRLVEEKNIESQDEMMNLLIKEGVTLTQPTLSRDFRELDIIKSTEGQYIIGEAHERERQKTLLKQLLSEEVEAIPEKPEIFFIQTRNESASLLGHLLKVSYPQKVIDVLAVGNSLIVVTNGGNKLFRKELEGMINEKKN